MSETTPRPLGPLLTLGEDDFGTTEHPGPCRFRIAYLIEEIEAQRAQVAALTQELGHVQHALEESASALIGERLRSHALTQERDAARAEWVAQAEVARGRLNAIAAMEERADKAEATLASLRALLPEIEKQRDRIRSLILFAYSGDAESESRLRNNNVSMNPNPHIVLEQFEEVLRQVRDTLT